MPVTPDFMTPNGFDLVTLSKAINLEPVAPGRLGEMGLFTPQGVSTRTVIIEEQSGSLALLPTVQPGGPATVRQTDLRTTRSFNIPHIPYMKTILAEDLQGKRKFGSDNETEGLNEVLLKEMTKLKRDHMVTQEFMRMGAVNGVVIDGGASTLYNLFTEFNVAEHADVPFILGTATTDVKEICEGVIEDTQDALGNAGYQHIHAMCGRIFWKKLISHPQISYAYQLWQGMSGTGDFLRSRRTMFEFGGITFEKYLGDEGIGGVPFIDESAEAVCRFFPVGTPDLFVEHYAPATWFETINTIGIPMYAKQVPTDTNDGIKLYVQSNPLPICTRPAALLKGTTAL